MKADLPHVPGELVRWLVRGDEGWVDVQVARIRSVRLCRDGEDDEYGIEYELEDPGTGNLLNTYHVKDELNTVPLLHFVEAHNIAEFATQELAVVQKALRDAKSAKESLSRILHYDASDEFA